jgi:TPR repeat protein
VCFLLSTAAMAGPLEDGEHALAFHHNETALKLLQRLAEQGNDETQLDIGTMYNYGWGLNQNFAKTVKWYRLRIREIRGQWNNSA